MLHRVKDLSLEQRVAIESLLGQTVSEDEFVSISLRPQLVNDRSQSPAVADEYTPEQRRMIDARLDNAEKGPFYGPFKNGAEVASFLKKRQGNVKLAKLKKAR